MVNLYRWLLFLYPAAYRHEFAREMSLCSARVKRPQQPRASPGDSHFAFASCQVCSLASCASRFAPFLASIPEPPLGTPEPVPRCVDSDDITRGQRRNKLLSLPDIQPVAICCVLATLSEQYALFYSPSDVVVAASALPATQTLLASRSSGMCFSS